MRRIRSLLAPLVWRLRAGAELTAEQADGTGVMQSLLITCLHPKGSWSYCTGGYRYCLRCMRVRVRC